MAVSTITKASGDISSQFTTDPEITVVDSSIGAGQGVEGVVEVNNPGYLPIGIAGFRLAGSGSGNAVCRSLSILTSRAGYAKIDGYVKDVNPNVPITEAILYVRLLWVKI